MRNRRQKSLAGLFAMARRGWDGTRHFEGLGQMQPVLLGRERGGHLALRIEGVEGGRPCWHVLPFPQCKARAKKALADLLEHKRNGTRSAASAAWEVSKAKESRA